MADYRDFEELIKDEEGSEPPKTPKKRIAKAALDKKETEKRPSKTPRKQKNSAQKTKEKALLPTSSMIMIEDEPFSSTFDEFIDYEEPAEPAKTPTRQTAEMTLGNEETPTTTPVKTPGKPKSTTPTAQVSTFEELSDIDKNLITMRDQGVTWPKIREWYAQETGTTPGKSSLSVRYMRIKATLNTFSEEDSKLLMEAKVEIEAEFEKEKWRKIANRMEEKGASEKHQVHALQKQFKKLSEQAK